MAAGPAAGSKQIFDRWWHLLPRGLSADARRLLFGKGLRAFTDGLVSEETARDTYGVVIDPQSHELDSIATQELRAILREQRVKPVK